MPLFINELHRCLNNFASLQFLQKKALTVFGRENDRKTKYTWSDVVWLHMSVHAKIPALWSKKEKSDPKTSLRTFLPGAFQLLMFCQCLQKKKWKNFFFTITWSVKHDKDKSNKFISQVFFAATVWKTLALVSNMIQT